MQVSARYLFRQRRCSLERFSALQASLQTVTTCRPRVYLSMRCGNHTCATQPASCLASHTSTGSPYQNAQENYRAELVPVRWLVGEALCSRPAVCPVPPGPPACSKRGSIRRTRPPAAWAAWRTMQRKSRRPTRNPANQAGLEIASMLDPRRRRSFDDAAGHSLGRAPGYVHQCGRTVRGFSLATAAYAPVNYMYRVVTLMVCIPTRRPRAAVPAARRESAAAGIYSEYQYSSAQVEQLPGCGSSKRVSMCGLCALHVVWRGGA